jgi:hypothetical protein
MVQAAKIAIVRVSTNALVLTGLAKIWVQLGCNNSSRGFRKAPRVAIGAVKLQLVTVTPRVPFTAARQTLLLPRSSSNPIRLEPRSATAIGDDSDLKVLCQAHDVLSEILAT